MPLEHIMPIPAGSQLTLDSMSSAESIQLLRNMLVAVTLKFPGQTVDISSSEMVRATLADYKFVIQPTADGQYIDSIKIKGSTKEGENK